jgi:hypothetical protein
MSIRLLASSDDRSSHRHPPGTCFESVKPGEDSPTLVNVSSQLSKLRAHHAVARTRGRLEPIAIPHNDAAVRVADDTRSLKGGSSHANRRSTGAQHGAQELMADSQFRPLIVARSERPTTNLTR